jgi:hypothetical protein
VALQAVSSAASGVKYKGRSTKDEKGEGRTSGGVSEDLGELAVVVSRTLGRDLGWIRVRKCVFVGEWL